MHLLRQLGDDQSHSGEALIGIVSLLGARPLGHPETDLPGRESAMAVLPPSAPSPPTIRADVAAREALSELAPEGC